MTVTSILFGIAVFFSSILAGGVVTVSLVMIPALRGFSSPADEFRVHRTFNPLPDYYMPQSLFISVFAGVAILIIDTGISEASRTLAWVAVAMSFPVILISLALNRRINVLIRRSSALPEGYAQLRADWDISHILRTVLCIIIAGCYIVAAGAAR